MAVTEADVLPIWVKQSKNKYIVIPLDKEVEWKKSFGIDENSKAASSGTKSYERTMELTSEGIEKFNGMAKITDQPNPVVTFLRGITVLKVGAVGEEMEYQWQYSTDNGKSWKNVNELTGKSEKLMMITSKKNQDRSYRCKIKTKEGIVYSKKTALIMK